MTAPAPDAATQAFFRAVAEGPFDHQRDAYEQGFEQGYEDGAADTRTAIREAADTRFAGWYIVRADLLDGAP